jgi:uncharacterized membrane protein
MNDAEEIKQLQEELKQLHVQLGEQQEKVHQLHRRLIQLGGAEKKLFSFSTSEGKLWSLENFIGLRLIHVVGVVVLVIGLSIGVKYAIDRNLISEVMRIALAYAAGIALYILSVRLKTKYKAFSSILFSGGMASLYFTTYGAYVYYDMLPFAMSFVIMIGLTVFTVYQAIVYSHEEIALLGLVGAYGIPFLISKNADRADLFFLYITVINIGVVYLCVKKPWRNVGRIAQAITWLLFIGWAFIRFDVKQQWIGLVFMSIFFLLFLFNSLSSRIFRNQQLALSNTYQVVVNNVALYIAALLVFGYSFADTDLAMVTIVVSLIAALQAGALHYLWQEEYATRIMVVFSFILFIVFIVFQWEGLTVTLLWLLVAIVVFVLGVVKKNSSLRMASILLMGATLLKLVLFDSLLFTTVQKVISYIVLGVLLLVVSYFYQKYKTHLFADKKE